MKRLISILMCLALLLSLIPVGMISASALVVNVYIHYMYTLPGATEEFTMTVRADAQGYVTYPNTPNRSDEGLTFYEWYADEDFEEVFDFSKQYTSTVHLYARWVNTEDMVTLRWFKYPDDEYPAAGISVPKGDYFMPPEPGEDGMVFFDWYTDRNFKNRYNGYVYEDTDLYARFAYAEDIVDVCWYLDPNDEEPVAGIDAVIGDTFMPAEPGREGKEFFGWYTDPEFKNKYNGFVSGNLNLYARFVDPDDICTIYLKCKDFVNPDNEFGYSEKIVKGDYYIPSPYMQESEESRRVLVGYYTDRNFTTKYDQTKPVESDVYLFPRFEDPENCYSISIFAGVEFNGPNDVFYVLKGDYYPVPDPYDPPSHLLRFYGWYSDRDLTVRFRGGNITGDICLFPRYVRVSGSSRVRVFRRTGDANPIETRSLQIGDQYMPAEPQADDGEVFVGWYTDADLVDFYNGTVDDDNLTLYARFVKRENVALVTVYPDPDDLTQVYTVRVAKGDSFTPEEPGGKPDRVFFAWYTDNEFDTAERYNGYIYEDTSLYARFVKFEDIVTLRWFLDPDDEYPAAGIEIVNLDWFTPPEPGREGKVFFAWYTDPDFENVYNGFVDGDTDLYARFVDADEIATVYWYLDPNDAEPVAGCEQIIGDYFTPAEPGREGKVFFDWYTDKNFKNRYNGIVEGDTDLYARFVYKNDIINLSWYLTADADEPVACVEVIKGDVFGNPPAPGREGEVFMGWYTDRALTKPYDFTAPILTYTELFPKFLPEGQVEYINIRIYFAPADPDDPDEIPVAGYEWPKGRPVQAPAEPGKEGATFGGWFLDPKLTVPFVEGTAYDHDINLFPKFTWPIPTITAFSNTEGGLKVTWTDVGEFEFYTLFRKGPKDKNWVKVAVAIEDNYYFDNTAVSGTTYTYTVRCVDLNKIVYTSGYNATGWTYTAYDMPELTKVGPTTNGMALTWTASKGAYGVKVFRKNDAGKWAALATVTGTSTSYVDKTVVSGNEYTYTVRAVNKSGKYITDFDPIGMTAAYVAMPKISGFENTATGAKMAWAKCTGAKKYRVFVKNSKGGWTKLADTPSLYYIHTAAVSGKSYTYTVRALDINGAYCSAFYAAGWTNKFIGTPAAPTLKNTKSGVQITSTLPAGAVKYCVFRKEAGATKWTRVITNIAASKKIVIDATAKNGKKYTYTIRCLSSDGKSYVSGYNATGRTITCKR